MRPQIRNSVLDVQGTPPSLFDADDLFVSLWSDGVEFGNSPSQAIPLLLVLEVDLICQSFNLGARGIERCNILVTLKQDHCAFNVIGAPPCQQKPQKLLHFNKILSPKRKDAAIVITALS